MRKVFLCIIIALLVTNEIYAQDKQQQKPLIVKPAKRNNPPSDAIIVFDGGNLSQFRSSNADAPAPWRVSGSKLIVVSETGNIQTKKHFGDMQLHIEFKIPREAKNKDGQQSGNSGIYIMGKYEIQVLNSHKNETYTDGQAGAIYDQYPPLVNASLKPGKWQEYDIIFKAPRFDKNGNMKEPPYITVFHNGVLIQNHAKVKGPTTAYNKSIPGKAEKGPLLLQDHNNEVRYRNIWIREL